ncbi:hypothetical protein TNCV_3482531 [Trichonephila clavipes]|nr:hypothetical protein TNCV_3482531 [Trichonephila clavipes]
MYSSRENLGSSRNFNNDRRDWDVRRMSTADRRNRNWRNAEVSDRQNDRRDNYRSRYGNGPLSNQRNHSIEPWIQTRNWFDRDNREFESRVTGSISSKIGVRVTILIEGIEDMKVV